MGAFKELSSIFRFLVLLLLISGSTLSQTSSTSLQGTVTDPHGGAVVGATVTLVDTDSGKERTAVTGATGEYRFQFLPPGTYQLSVAAAGFARHEKTGLQVLVNTPSTVNIELKIGATTETVSVTSEAPP